jgi:hypothetical protein
VVKEAGSLNDIDKEALKFLDRDFTQCFTQMRHYDGQIFETCKFAFTGYVGLIGVSLTLFQFGIKEKVNLSIPILASLFVGLLLGIFMFCIVIRNRVYFVQSARYINEQRRLFFNYSPLGFQNQSRMYIDSSLPPYWDYRSSQTWFAFVIALLNSILLAVSILIYSNSINSIACSYMIIMPLVLFIVQMGGGRHYLRTRENKSAERSVFGRNDD